MDMSFNFLFLSIISQVRGNIVKTDATSFNTNFFDVMDELKLNYLIGNEIMLFVFYFLF